jgi:hypothetical protein
MPLFRKTTEYEPAATLEQQISRLESIQAERDRLTNISRATRERYTSLLQSDSSLLLSHSDDEISGIRQEAHAALRQSRQAADALDGHIRQFGTAEEIEKQLADLYRQMDERDKKRLREQVNVELQEQIRLLEALRRTEENLGRLRAEAKSRFGDWAEKIPQLPQGFVPSPAVPISCAFVTGYKFLLGKQWDARLLPEGDEVRPFLSREVWPAQLMYGTWH